MLGGALALVGTARAWADSSRSRRVAELLVALWLLGLADLLLTLWAHLFTPLYELNPLARSLLQKDLLLLLVTVKVGSMMAGSTIFWRLRHLGRAELALWGVTLVYVLLAFRWQDYTLSAARMLHLASS